MGKCALFRRKKTPLRTKWQAGFIQLECRGIMYLALLLVLGIQVAFARPMYEEDQAAPRMDTERPMDTDSLLNAESLLTHDILNNPFFLESKRHAELALNAFQAGDYDAATGYANESIRYAQLSDEYVALQAVAAAKARIEWALSSGVSRQHPAKYNEAETWYQKSLRDHESGAWDSAIEAAQKVVELLASTSPALPATYTVRAWNIARDCFWNIAGYPWVYGDPHRWRTLYNANRSKLPQPDNPNRLEPGTVLDIPSIRGELRQGAWDPNTTYSPLN